jgi:uncharacterized protein (DUF302 family)
MVEVAGIVTKLSSRGVRETLERLLAVVRSRGLTHFATIDHAAGAAAVGLSLRPSTVVIFGNARAGTPLMAAARLLALELPLRVLVWEEADGRARVSYLDPASLGARFGIDAAQMHALDAIHAVTDAVVAP